MFTNASVNLPVADLPKTKEFWTKLGFTFNPQFTDETAACLVLGTNLFAMLMTHEAMRRFTKKEITDAWKATETINAYAVASKEEVDKLVDAALSAGGKKTRETEDYGWMYSRSFEDLDGHQWEVLWMDPKHLQ